MLPLCGNLMISFCVRFLPLNVAKKCTCFRSLHACPLKHTYAQESARKVHATGYTCFTLLSSKRGVIPLRREWRQSSGTEVTVVSKCNIKHQLKSRFTSCNRLISILPPSRPMKAISGVLKSPWGALSIRRIISLIGGDFWQIEWVKKEVTLCRARPISPPHPELHSRGQI